MALRLFRNPFFEHFLCTGEDDIVECRVFLMWEREEDEVFRGDMIFGFSHQQARLAEWAADTDTNTEEILCADPFDDVDDAIVSGGG